MTAAKVMRARPLARRPAGVPLTEVQQPPGHAQIGTATVCSKMTNPERPSYTDHRSVA